MPDDFDATPERRQFAPLESPYSGLAEACARMRANMAQLDKYLTALELDAEYLGGRPRSHELPTTRLAPEALAGASFAAPNAPEAPRPAQGPRGKSWRTTGRIAE